MQGSHNSTGRDLLETALGYEAGRISFRGSVAIIQDSLPTALVSQEKW